MSADARSPDFAPLTIGFAECPEPYFGRAGEAPLRLATVAAAAREAGHRVFLEDGGVHADFESWARAVADGAPRLLFIHGDTKHLSLASRLAEAVADLPSAPLRVLWGNHSDARDLETLGELPAIDAVIRLDPEDTLLAVAERLATTDGRRPDLGEVAGVTWRRPAEGDAEEEEAVREAPAPPVNLDALPTAARDLIDGSRYHDFRGPVLGQIFTARGCAYRCTFCEEAPTTLQRRSPERVVDEMLELREAHGINRFTIRDPLFGPRRHLLAVCREMIERLPGVSFYCLTHPNQVDEETADALRDAGAWCVDMGVESGDPEVLASYGKGSTLDSVRRAVRLLKERGISVQLNLVLGGPRDTVQTLRRSVDFFLSLAPDHHCVTLVQPVPGTPLYRELEESGRLRAPPSWDDYYTNPFYELRDGHPIWGATPRYDRMIQLEPDVVAELDRCYRTLGRRMLGVRVRAALRGIVTGSVFRRPGGPRRLLHDGARALRFALRRPGQGPVESSGISPGGS